MNQGIIEIAPTAGYWGFDQWHIVSNVDTFGANRPNGVCLIDNLVFEGLNEAVLSEYNTPKALDNKHLIYFCDITETALHDTQKGMFELLGYDCGCIKEGGFYVLFSSLQHEINQFPTYGKLLNAHGLLNNQAEAINYLKIRNTAASTGNPGLESAFDTSTFRVAAIYKLHVG